MLLLILCINFCGIYGGQYENRLLRQLFNTSRSDSHNNIERPVINEGLPIEIRMKFYFIKLINVNEKNENIEINMWFGMKWRDYHFQWKPELYNDITKLSIPSEKIWKPDILLYNSANQNFLVTYPVQIVVHNTSLIEWDPPGLFKSTCDIDIKWFPFDRQECHLRFESWTYDKYNLDLRIICPEESEIFNNNNCSNSGQLSLEYFKMSSEFNLINNSVKRIKAHYENESYIFLEVTLSLKRRPLYYIWNLIIPCIFISVMSVLVFLLPPDAGEKISLGVTVLLAMTMFMLLVSDKLPQSSSAIPLICLYFLSTIILCSLSLIFTVIVLYCHHQSTTLQPVSSWIKYFINNWLAKFLFMKMENIEKCQKEDFLRDIKELNEIREDATIIERSSKEIIIISEEIKKITKKIEEDEIKELMAREWKFAARVIDRSCLIFFSLFNFLSGMVIFTRAP